jgi:hypothetical protein
MKKFIKISLAAALASASMPTVAAEPTYEIDKVHADSSLKFLDIWSVPKFVRPRLSPDGKLIATGTVNEDGQATLHVVDRKTMKVIYSEAFTGGISVGSISWHDNDRLIINPTGRSKLAEGRMGYGSYFLNIRTRDLRPIWLGETADLHSGGGEGGSLGQRIDDDNYYMTIFPSGSNEAEMPYNYL